MALESFAGNFAINTSLGNQSITGVGFQPKIVLFFPTNMTADGVIEHAHACIGAAISSSSRFAIATNSEDAQAAGDNHRESTTTKCIVLNTPGTATALYEADFVSQDIDGFTINVTTNPGSGFRVGFLALGGADLTNVFIGNFAANIINGNQAETGVGFQPDAMLAWGMSSTSATTSATNMHFTMGAAISSTKRANITVKSRNTPPTMDTSKRSGAVDCFYQLAVSGQAEDADADFVSFDADGFTWDWTNAPPTADIVFYVCLKGGQYDIGTIQSQTSTGNFSKTGVGFQPTGALFMSTMSTVTTIETGNEASLGIASGSTEQFALGWSDEDNVSTSDADSYSDDNRIYLNYDYNQTKEGDISFVSFGADGFTLNQTDADPSQLDIFYFVVGSDAVITTTTTTLPAVTGIGFISATPETFSKPSYELWLTDDFGKRIAQLTTFLTLEASRVANQIAFFNTTMPLSFDPNLIQPDRMVQLWRSPRGGRLKLWRVYFIREWEFATRGSEQLISFGGPDTNDLLRRRIVAAFSGTSQAKKTDFADDAMKEVVTESIADGVAPVPSEGTRVWNDLSIASDLGLGPTITKSFPFGKLLNKSGQGVLPNLAKAAREEGTEVFFDIVPDVISGSSASFQFQTFTGQPGQDHTSRLVFEQGKNMANPSLKYDYTDEINYIYAGGQGEGSDRNIQQVADSDRYSISQWARIEHFADARNEDSDNGVIAAGNDALSAGRPKVRFTAIPLDVRGTRFMRDWDIGDKVKVKYLNIEFDTIIRAVSISVNESGEEKIGARLDFES